MKFQGILAVAAILIVLSGLAYILRPNETIEIPHVPTPTPIDNTVQFPPREAKPMTIQPINQAVQITLKTTKGDIELILDGAKAPKTVGNFVTLALDDFYDGVIFHRVIPDFMIQGGDPTGTGTGGPGYQFEDEINDRKIVRGSVAMANAGPGTNGSQFFIVTATATPYLDGKHTNFGEVTTGMDVVDAISQVATDANDKPLKPITIQDVVVHNVSKVTPDAPALKVE